METNAGLEWWAQNWPGMDSNLMVFVDGGRRSNGLTAAAFAVFALRNGMMRLVGKRAVVGRDGDSFLAGCRSMHLATTSLYRVLSRLGNRNGPGQHADHRYI